LKKIICILSLSLLSGCVTINEEMLRTSEIPELNKRNILVEVKTGDLVQKLNGQGQNNGVLSGTTVLNAVATSMMERWKSKNVISDYDDSGSLEKDPDYTLTLSGVRNEDGSIGGAILSGLTLMLIPVSSTLTYDLNVELTNNHTHKQSTVKVKNAVTTWMQILLLPALPFSWIGSHNMLTDMADYAYSEFNKKNIFSD